MVGAERGKGIMADIRTPLLTVDCVIVADGGGDGVGGVVLIRRGRPPFLGHHALPGGFVDLGETVEAACVREVAEETGLTLDPAALRLVGVYSDPRRDPRGHSVSVAFTARASTAGLAAGDDAAAAEVVTDWRACDLAFDHAQILEDALQLWA